MAEQTLYAGRQLLDREIATVEGRSVGKVDDLEIDLDHPGGPVVSALLTGQIAIGARFRGRRNERSARSGVRVPVVKK